WSAVALGAATMIKFFPLVLVPTLWRPARSNLGDWRWLTAFIALIIAAYLPYIGVGWGVLGVLPGYVVEANLRSGHRVLLPPTHPPHRADTAGRLSEPRRERHRRAGAWGAVQATGATLRPVMGNSIDHGDAVFRVTSLSMVLCLAGRAADGCIVVASLVAHC